MSVYLDASILCPLFIMDGSSERARAYLREVRPKLVISDFLRAEFASVASRIVRMGKINRDDANTAFANMDDWSAHLETAETVTEDVRRSEAWLRRLDLNLRAPDAVHIAIAFRLNASLATFDIRMAEAAQALGVSVEPV